MRNAALTLGVIAGIIGMMVGFAGYGWAELTLRHAELAQVFGPLENPALVQAAAILAPLLAIAGGAMARARALWGGGLLLASAAGMWHAFGFNVFTMFPIAFAAAAGLLALAAGRPDEPKAHF